MAKNESETRVFDVTRPGRTAATPTSKPVIVGHGPSSIDPMMQRQSEVDNKARFEAVASKQKVLEPSAQVDAELASHKPDAQDAPAQPEVKVATAPPSDADINTADPAHKPKVMQQSDEEQARQQELKKLIDDKTYVLPIGSTVKGPKKKIILSVCLLVFALAATAFYFIVLPKLTKI